jgi:hypothetical protein
MGILLYSEYLRLTGQTADVTVSHLKESVMKPLEKKLRETLKEGTLVSSDMHPFAKRMLQRLKESPKSVPPRTPGA